MLENLPELVVKEVQGSGGYGMLIGPAATQGRDRGVPRAHQGEPGELHRAADAVALDLPDLRRARRRAAPRRPAALRAVGQGGEAGARRPDARRAEGGLAGGQFLAGRRHQGHLGRRLKMGQTRFPHARDRVCPDCLMLSRVADRIFWMSRQMERAENMARILGVTSNMVLFGTKETREQNLLAPLTITDSAEALLRAARQAVTLAALIDFLGARPEQPLVDLHLPASWARENAHAVRWQITSEMWETLNATWIEMRASGAPTSTGAGATQFFDWVKDRSAPLPRRHLRHHHARRGVQLLAPGHLPRARRQHRAHPRREVPRPAALGGGRRRRARLLPVDGAAALGVRRSRPTAASTATRSSRSRWRSC